MSSENPVNSHEEKETYPRKILYAIIDSLNNYKKINEEYKNEITELKNEITLLNEKLNKLRVNSNRPLTPIVEHVNTDQEDIPVPVHDVEPVNDVNSVMESKITDDKIVRKRKTIFKRL